MNFSDESTLWIAYSVSNIVGLIFLFAAIKRPKWARILFFLLFGWACYFNYTTSHAQPEVYLGYSEHALEIYSDFIEGWFSDKITIFVSALAIGQGLIAIGMLLNKWWVRLACIGSIVFLLAIAPLGLYAAFPFSLTVSAAAYFILKNDDLKYIWE